MSRFAHIPTPPPACSTPRKASVAVSATSGKSGMPSESLVSTANMSMIDTVERLVMADDNEQLSLQFTGTKADLMRLSSTVSRISAQARMHFPQLHGRIILPPAPPRKSTLVIRPSASVFPQNQDGANQGSQPGSIPIGARRPVGTGCGARTPRQNEGGASEKKVLKKFDKPRQEALAVKPSPKAMLSSIRRNQPRYNECCAVCRQRHTGKRDLFHKILEDDAQTNRFHDLGMDLHSLQLKTSCHEGGFNAVFNDQQFPPLDETNMPSRMQSVDGTLLFEASGKRLHNLFNNCVWNAFNKNETNIFHWQSGKKGTFAVECKGCQAYVACRYGIKGEPSTPKDRTKAIRMFVAFLTCFATTEYPPEGKEPISTSFP